MKAKEGVATHSTELGPMAGSASMESAPAVAPAAAPAATAVSSPASPRTDAPAPLPTATIEPDLTGVHSSDWQSELVQLVEMNAIENVTHQRGGTDTGGIGKHYPDGAYQENTNTEAHNTDQTPKPNVKITYMVLTRDQGRERIKTYWPEGSLSGKTLRGVIQEAEALVGRVDTEKVEFELKGLRTTTRYRFPANDEKIFEDMRKDFNKETRHERKNGRLEFEIRLELIGGKEHGDHEVDNRIDEQSDFEDTF